MNHVQMHTAINAVSDCTSILQQVLDDRVEDAVPTEVQRRPVEVGDRLVIPGEGTTVTVSSVHLPCTKTLEVLLSF